MDSLACRLAVALAVIICVFGTGLLPFAATGVFTFALIPLVIDLSMMKGVRADPVSRAARVGPGCTTGDVDHATFAGAV